ncbi:MAG: GPR endopeptidase [Clostridia bacterium]|nr:GPR endopeptidase [Clostridia bacterium]
MNARSNERTDKYIETDLACESGKLSPEEYRSAKYEKKTMGEVIVETLTVSDDEGVSESGKKIGTYVTISDDSPRSEKDVSLLSEIIEAELKKLFETIFGKCPDENTKVLIAGLGNRFVTPDALGSKCADKINATRHIKDAYPVLDGMGCADVSVISPGVLGQTGIESSEILRGISRRIGPDLIIAIDAMAARKVSRLATTVQISDAGLSPGGGIGNNRPEIDKESMGCPVISIGSPTVVGSSTLITDALEEAGITDISPALEKILENGKSFFVTLNDSDRIIERISDAISCAINNLFGTTFLT